MVLLPTMALTVPTGMPRSHTSTAEYAAPASAGLGLSCIRRANVRPAPVLPLSAGQPAPDAMTARASRPDGTSDVGAMSVYAAIDEVAVSDANAPVAPASEPTMPRAREAEAIRRNAMTEG